MNIFLDFDGTIADIATRHFEVYTRCVNEFKGTPLSRDVYWDNKRKNTRWVDLLTLSNIDSIYENEFLECFVELIEKPDMLKIDLLFDDSISLLDRLSKNNKLILVSLRRNHNNLLDQIHLLGINEYFTEVLSGHSETKEGTLSKKAEVIRKIDNFQDGIIIGDTEADISAAKQLNLPVIAVTTGVRDRNFLSKYQPDYIVDSLTQAMKIVLR